MSREPIASRKAPAGGVDEPVRRLTLSELSRGLLDAMRRGGSDHSSVELTRNARGDTQIRVSVRTGEAGIDSPEDAANRCTALYDRLRERYPLAEPTASAEAGSSPRKVPA